MSTSPSSPGLFAPRSFLTALAGATALALIGCGGGGSSDGTGGTVGSGGSGSGGATTGSGGSGSGGTVGSGGAVGSGGTVGSGGAPVDAPVDMVTMEVAPEAAPDVPAGPFALTSTAFTMGMEIPLMHKCAQGGNIPIGMNISPPFSWGPGPAGTMSYAMTLIHDAPDMSRHWAIWDIPANVLSLPMNIEHVAMPPMPAGSKQQHHVTALDGFTGYGYLGPCPQAVGSRQNYLFTLYAIRVATIPNITPESSVAAVFTAIQANAVSATARATLRGTQIQTQ